MPALARLGEVEARAPDDDLAAMLEEELEELLEIEQPRLSIDQRDHVHAEAVLQLRQLEQIVGDDVGNFAPFELDHHAHARLVGFVAQIGDAFELFLAHQLADAGQQIRLVDLIRDLVDDDRLAVPAIQILDVRARTDDDAAASGAIALADALEAVNDSGGRKIGRRNDVHQLVDRDAGIGQDRQTAIDRLVQVVRWNVGRHADRNARRSVDEQVRKPRRQHRRFRLLAIVVRHEIDGFLVDVGQHVDRDPLQPAFGVAIRRRRIAVDGTEVSLAVDQRIAERKRLDHPYQRLVGRRVAMRVVFAEHIADDARTFDVGPVPRNVGLVHCI